MVEYEYGIGDIAFFNGIRNRIIYFDEEKIVLCRMDTTKLLIYTVPMANFSELLMSGKCEIIRNQEKRIAEEVIRNFSENTRANYRIRKDIADRITEAYGPDYLGLMGKQPKPVISEILEEYAENRQWLWRIIRKYIQGGLTDVSLLNADRGAREKSYSMKTGRPSIVDNSNGYIVSSSSEEAFSYGLDFWKSGRARSCRSAYNRMNAKYFSVQKIVDGKMVSKLLPISERPTFHQFYYWCHKRFSPVQLDIAKTSAMEHRNNRRIKKGDSSWHVEYPGEGVQVDALEVDLSLVSLEDFGQTVSRCVVYGMRDMLTHAVVAVAVSFENNSTLGWSNLMLNLCEDKKELCRKFGLEVENIENVWPSHFLPNFMINDCGAEYRSRKVEEILNGLKITKRDAPPGTGSLKGLIEQWFHQIHADIKPYIEGHGMISRRHDSKHHEQAVLTVSEFTKMLYVHLITYNQSHMNDYMRTAEMVEDGVDATPVLLWDYGCRKKGSPRPIANNLDYMYKFLEKKVAKLSNECITMSFTGLRYHNPKDTDLTIKMSTLGEKKANFPVMYDPRDNSRIYYFDESGTMRTAELLTGISWMDSLKGRTFREVEDYVRNSRIADALARQRNEQIGADRALAYEGIVREAEKRQKGITPRTDNLREAQKKEKNLVNREQSLVRKIESEKLKEYGCEELPASADVPSATLPEKRPMTEEEINRAYEEALEDMY